MVYRNIGEGKIVSEEARSRRTIYLGDYWSLTSELLVGELPPGARDDIRSGRGKPFLVCYSGKSIPTPEQIGKTSQIKREQLRSNGGAERIARAIEAAVMELKYDGRPHHPEYKISPEKARTAVARIIRATARHMIRESG